ncbi:unnamed protein product [Cyprideis torosa]|uniref:Uncharacterized protein n=1 Tax=Cyprideis torosa TaxID=163714 RepID=A0A7R8WFE6_9CRUS|nr:unnamed protein product [Cyprideis torosa]CAG0891396.1 unnamed protein product [Cyprideis torosa]
MYRLVCLLILVVSLALVHAAPAPQTSTRDTSHGFTRNQIEDIMIHIADEAPGSNNKSNNKSTNTSCCSSDPKGSSNSSSNKSSNRSVNFDDFREDKASSKKGPSAGQLVALARFLKARGINFKVRKQ